MVDTWQMLTEAKSRLLLLDHPSHVLSAIVKRDVQAALKSIDHALGAVQAGA